MRKKVKIALSLMLTVAMLFSLASPAIAEIPGYVKEIEHKGRLDSGAR